MKPTYTLIDSSFHPFGQESASLGGDRHGEAPHAFQWSRQRQPGPVFYTDMRLNEVDPRIRAPQIAWLLEPPWKPDKYRTALRLADRFDYILSYHRDYFSHLPNYLYYPIGGSWIKSNDWQLYDKTENVSIIGTNKTAAPGHKFRHSAIKSFGGRVDVYGRGYNPIVSKLTALASYRYSVVMESERLDCYFTEKLIDCLLTGTVPIYWGDWSVLDNFDERGFLLIGGPGDIRRALTLASPSHYEFMLPFIRNNFELAKQFTCAEDWIFDAYPLLFE